MVNTPRTRHSGSEREPATIELGPGDVSRVEDAASGTSGADAVQDETAQDEAAREAAAASEGAAAETAASGREAGSSSAPPSAAQPVRDRSRGGSRGSALGAGLGGGVVALALAGLLQYAGVLGAPGTGGTDAPAVPAAVDADIAKLKSEVAALKTSVEAGNEAGGETADLSGITGQVDGLSQALDQVKADVAALKQAVEAGGAGENAGLEALNGKIAEIESRIASIGAGAGTGAADPQELAALADRIAGIETLAKAATVAVSAADGRIGAVEQGLAALSGKVDTLTGQPKIALAIATSALKAAIERGAPFQAEIETFAAIAPDAPGLTELRAYAEKGVATRAEIAGEADAAAKAMIAAASPPSENAGFFERLLSSAESLVSVRPIGAVEGPGVPETVARMEVALQGGDFAAAMAEFDTLPEGVRAAGAALADKIRARVAAEQLADRAIAAAMQAS